MRSLLLGVSLLAACGAPKSSSQSDIGPKTDKKQTNSGTTGTLSSYFDLRPDATIAPTAPTLDSSIDPRTFVPSGTFTPGAGKMSSDFLSKGHLLVADDGRSYELPACEYAFPAPGHASPSGLKIDGDLSDWSVANLVGIDRAGDGAGGVDYLDMRESYFASDNNYYYFAFKVGGTWPATSTNGQIDIDIQTISLPSDDKTLVSNKPVLEYGIFGTALIQFPLDGGSGSVLAAGTGAGQVDFKLATHGSGIELKIARSVVDAAVGSSPFAINVFSYCKQNNTDCPGANSYDYIGAHIVGLNDDYACLVPLPGKNGTFDSFKMFVMRHADGVDVNNAEQDFRAIVAAAPTDEYVAKDHYSSYDTVSYSSINYMAAAGLYTGTFGIYLHNQAKASDGEYLKWPLLYHIAAHEYFHGFNSADYDLPDDHWIREGHSEWMAGKSTASYYGEGIYQQELASDVLHFLDKEASAGIEIANETNWGAAAYELPFFYNKSRSFYEMLATNVDYDDFLDNILHKGDFADDTAMLEAIKGLSSYKGKADDDLSSGWFSGKAYASAASIRPALLADTDDAGYFDFQKTALGASASKASTAGDYTGDIFKISQGLDVQTALGAQYLAADNNLDDWAALLPDELHTHTGTAQAGCPATATIKRYGLIYNEGWLYFAIELSAQPAANADLAGVLFYKWSGGSGSAQFEWGSNDYAMWDNKNTLVRDGKTLAVFDGTVLESGINAAWIGWKDGIPPSDLTVDLAVYSGSTECDQTDYVSPSYNMPQ